jgi:hypothetical protein
MSLSGVGSAAVSLRATNGSNGLKSPKINRWEVGSAAEILRAINNSTGLESPKSETSQSSSVITNESDNWTLVRRVKKSTEIEPPTRKTGRSSLDAQVDDLTRRYFITHKMHGVVRGTQTHFLVPRGLQRT